MNVYDLGKCWEVYLYHSVWWNEQFPARTQDGARRSLWELHSSQCHSAKAHACCRAEHSLSLGIDLCNHHRAIFFFLCFQLGCSDVTKDKIWAAVYLLLEIMCVVEGRQGFFPSSGWICRLPVGTKTSLCAKLVNFPWMSLGENKHRAPWILKLFLQSQSRNTL